MRINHILLRAGGFVECEHENIDEAKECMRAERLRLQIFSPCYSAKIKDRLGKEFGIHRIPDLVICYRDFMGGQLSFGSTRREAQNAMGLFIADTANDILNKPKGHETQA